MLHLIGFHLKLEKSILIPLAVIINGSGLVIIWTTHSFLCTAIMILFLPTLKQIYQKISWRYFSNRSHSLTYIVQQFANNHEVDFGLHKFKFFIHFLLFISNTYLYLKIQYNWILHKLLSIWLEVWFFFLFFHTFFKKHLLLVRVKNIIEVLCA